METNQAWADRLGDLSDLGRLAADANRPGNDVFRSGDVNGAWWAKEAALDRFARKLTKVEADLATGPARARAPELPAALAAIRAPMRAMSDQADEIFRLFRADRSQAGAHMAAMDQAYDDVNRVLVELGQRVRDTQTDLFDEQTALAARLRRFEMLIAGLILLMVCGVTFYGHKLARRIKAAAEETDAYLSELAASEERLQAIIDNTTAVVYLKDTAGRYLLINRRFEDLFSVRREQVVGQTDHDLFPAGTADTFRRNDRLVLERRSAVEFEEIAPHDDGPHTYLSVKFPLNDRRGNPYAICGISTDITDRKRAENELALHRDRLEQLVARRTEELQVSYEQLRLNERMASIGTLAAGLGHDMNNVLFPIRCRLDALEAGRLEPNVKHELDAIRGSVQYLQQLSDGLRLLSLDPENPDAASGSTNLTEWWDEARQLFETALPAHARLESDLPDDIPGVAVAPHRLTQAMFNLVVNAGEAITQSGTVRIWARRAGDGRTVRLGVTDDGHGMSPEHRRQALDPFFTTKKRRLSTGLGLALVHGVATAAGGEVSVDSTEGRGTTVVMTLPVVEPDPDAGPAGAADDARVATVSLPDRRLATFVGALLRSAGFRVNDASDGDPGRCSVWVTDASDDALTTAKRFLAEEESRNVIVIGEHSPAWARLGATVVDRSGGIEAIQKAIRSLLTEGGA